MSQSQLDLFIHDHDHGKTNKRDKLKNDTENFIRSEAGGHSSGKQKNQEFDMETKV